MKLDLFRTIWEKIECWELSSLKALQVLLYVFQAAKWVTAVKNIGFDISYSTGEDKGGEQSEIWMIVTITVAIYYELCSTLIAGKSSTEVLSVLSPYV